ncbi:MAG: universal stress protein [Solirubrobacterales bacterium]|nr:universal stress protein [Solirubrobacterales bacterium]
MFASIVVGTDGSETARVALRDAVDLARRFGARLAIVSAYEPAPEPRLRRQRLEVPEDLQWMVSPRADTGHEWNPVRVAGAASGERPTRWGPSRRRRRSSRSRSSGSAWIRRAAGRSARGASAPDPVSDAGRARRWR